jgi:hypothetical protein
MIDSKYYNIIEKLFNYKSLSENFIGQSYSGINSNDERLIDINTKTTLLCYVSQQKGFIKYIEKDKLVKERDFNKWKSILDSRSQKGIHLFGGTEFESLSEDYFLTGLPRGITIDTKGRIVLNRAPQVADLKIGDFSAE